MIHNLKPYPAMKDSGVPWLGQMPEHWYLRRLDKLFKLRKEEPQENDQRVTGYLDGRVTLRSNVQGQKIKGVIKEAGWQRIHPGDFAISGMNAHLGGMGVSDSLGKCSPIYLVLEPLPDTNARFVSLAVRHVALSGAIKSLVQTIRFNSADLKRDDLKKIAVWLPPLEEQAAIVHFLDHADRRIRKAIATKQRLIKLLQEQKQVIIHQAVTRGIDPNVKLRPSGVEWLGEMPEGWELVPLKFLATKFGSGVTPRGGATVYQEQGVPLLRSQNVHFGKLILEGVARIPKEVHASMSSSHVKGSDVLLNITGASIGRTCVAPPDIGDANVNQHVCIIRPRTAIISPDYLSYYLSAPLIQRQIRNEQNGSSREGLTLDAIKSFLIPVPSLTEQQDILRHLLQEAASMDSAKSRIEQEISLLREYRTRLITDVVTGKLDVRDAAVQLPELVDDAPDADLASEAEGEETDLDDSEVEGAEA